MTGYSRWYTRCWLLLCYSSVRRPLYSDLCHLTASTERHGELWWTWNRSCFDDVPEDLGSGFLSFFLQITAQINMLALADPEQATASESHPPGNCLHCHCLSSLSALCWKRCLKLIAAARLTGLKGLYFRPTTVTTQCGQHTSQTLD